MKRKAKKSKKMNRSPAKKVKKVSKKNKQIKKSAVVKFFKKIRSGKKKSSRPAARTEQKPQKYSFLDAPAFKTKIKVIGIGGGGGSIVSEIGRSLEKATFVIADTDVRSMKKKSMIKDFYFGQAVTHGLGTGMNPDLAKEAAVQERERINKLLENQDIIILVGSLGGGLASGAAPVFAQASRDLGNVTLGIFTTPFRFEGNKKARIAQKALQKLREHLNAVITIPNEKIFKIIDEKTSITEAFSTVNKNLIESLESLIEMIYNPGMINIDFADVRAILKGRGMTAFLNIAEASGKNRAEEINEKILKNPLISSNLKPEKILFDISGASNLSMLEVDKISRRISELNPKAKIIFGISKNQKSKNKIKTTLLITGPSIAMPKEEEPVPAKVIAAEEQKTAAVAKPAEAKKAAVPVKKENKKEEKEKKPVIFKSKITRKKEPAAKKPVPKKIVSAKTEEKQEKPAEKKEMIRRNALEARKVEEVEESRRIKEDAEWEIPAFLRRMKFKS